MPPESDRSRLEVEIVKSQSGIRMYINILFLQAPPCVENPERTKVDILFEETSQTIYPYLLQGGQRLLLTDEDADLLIQTLLDGRSFTIKLGRHEVSIIPDQFATVYTQLKS